MIKKLILIFAIPICVLITSCEAENKNEIDQPNQNLSPPERVLSLPVKMIQSPNGTLFFEENIHMPRSTKDVNVIVSRDKIDTLSSWN